MIAPAKIKEIERLLAEGTRSQRMIARHAGVSRATVRGIAAGSRPDYEARRLARELDHDGTLGPIVRCGECGGRVYAPCRLCRVRKLKAEEHAKLNAARGAGRRASRGAKLPAAAPSRTEINSIASDPRMAG